MLIVEDNMVSPLSDLPNELLENIGNRLNTKLDVSRFRAVCHSWRSSIPPFQKQLPSSILFRGFGKKTLNLTLSESVVYYLEPPPTPPPFIPNLSRTWTWTWIWISNSITGNWVIKVKEGELGRASHLLHPLSPYSLDDELPKSLPKALNTLDFRVTEMAKALYLSKDNHVFHWRVAMSSNSNFPALMFVDFGTLYHYKLGVDDDTENYCTPIYDGVSQCKYEDVIFYQGKFYAVDQDGRAVVADSSLNLKTIASPQIDTFFGDDHKYLVESFGDLILIDRYRDFGEENSEAVRFKVYKLNVAEKQWVEMESLGDRILFVGEDCCFSASAQDFPAFQRNCIYISYWHKQKSSRSSLRKMGVFNLDDGCFVTLETLLCRQ